MGHGPLDGEGGLQGKLATGGWALARPMSAGSAQGGSGSVLSPAQEVELGRCEDGGGSRRNGRAGEGDSAGTTTGQGGEGHERGIRAWGT